MTGKRIKQSIRRRILERDGYRCVECGITADKMTMCVDHILARCLGGTDRDENLRALCAPCNGEKALKEFRAWRQFQ